MSAFKNYLLRDVRLFDVTSLPYSTNLSVWIFHHLFIFFALCSFYLHPNWMWIEKVTICHRMQISNPLKMVPEFFIITTVTATFQSATVLWYYLKFIKLCYFLLKSLSCECSTRIYWKFPIWHNCEEFWPSYSFTSVLYSSRESQ